MNTQKSRDYQYGNYDLV